MSENMDLFQRIDEKYQQFSKGQKRLADFLRESYDKAAFFTAAKLGTEVGVSESTVVRFATELDYDGYPELQKAVGTMVRTHSNSIQRLETAVNQMEDMDLVQSILAGDSHRIKETKEIIDEARVSEVADQIIGAKNIYILGVRSSWYLAGILGYYFRMIFDNVHVIETGGNADTLEQICRIKQEDVFIGISFPRYSKRTAQAMEYAKNQGATIITLTDSLQSPLIPLADYHLTAKSDVIAIVDSLVAPQSVIEALVVCVCMKKKDDLEERLHTLEELWKVYGVYDDHMI